MTQLISYQGSTKQFSNVNFGINIEIGLIYKLFNRENIYKM